MSRGGWIMVCFAAGSSVWSWGCLRSGAWPPTLSRTVNPQSHVRPLVVPNRIQTPSTAAIPSQSYNPWKPDVAERDWRHIVIHHTGTDAGSVESINRAHLQRKDRHGNRWLGIGYHFVIGNGNGMGDGEIEPTFRWKDQMQGAHAGVSEYNEYGIGIALVGNFQQAPPSPAQIDAVKNLVAFLKQAYGIAENHVMGHSDVKATACPGKYLPLDDIRHSRLLSSARDRLVPVAVQFASTRERLQP